MARWESMRQILAFLLICADPYHRGPSKGKGTDSGHLPYLSESLAHLFQSFSATLAVFFVGPLNSDSPEPLNGTLLPQGSAANFVIIPSECFSATLPQSLGSPLVWVAC
jgi:hypothetical protein